MLDPTPWLVSTPGAQHSAEVARTLAYSATQGATGVIGASSFRVTSTSVPSNQVRVNPGVACAVSKYPGHSGQTYIMRAPSNTLVNIAPTSSSGGRTDAIVARVDDASLVGQPPADPNNYSYTKLEVIQGVPSSLKYAVDLKLNYPFVLLAKVQIPASTGTITDSMITNLREVVNPREESVVRTYHLGAGQTTTIHNTSNFPVGQNFPQTATYPSSLRTIRVPEWATEMEVRAEWLSVKVPAHSQSASGRVWVTWGLRDGDTADRIQPSVWVQEDTSNRQNFIAMDTAAVKEEFRGRDVIFAPRAMRQLNTGAQVEMDFASAFTLQVRFLERAD